MTTPAPTVNESRTFWVGAGWAFLTILIWAGWSIATRIGVTQSMGPLDIAFLRYTFAGLFLLPVALRERHYFRECPKLLIALMLLGAGAPYGLVTAMGFMHAPATHSVLIPGTMPLFVGILAAVLLGDRPGPLRLAGLLLILCGVIFKLVTSAQAGGGLLMADGFFLLGALLWAIYTIANRRAALPPLVATAYVAIGSMLVIIVPYAIDQFERPHGLPLNDALFQMFYQGFMTSIVSLVAFNRAVALIGAGRAAAFAALVPAMVTILAIPLLGELPTAHDILFVSMMTLGVLLATGAVRLPVRRQVFA